MKRKKEKVWGEGVILISRQLVGGGVVARKLLSEVSLYMDHEV